jgi:ribosomal protein L11 methylase PrmA
VLYLRKAPEEDDDWFNQNQKFLEIIQLREQFSLDYSDLIKFYIETLL